MNQFSKSPREVQSAEHISPQKTGDNIEAKRAASYVWDSTLGLNGEWRRDTGTDPTYTTRIDDTTTADTTYIGKAAIGTATSGAVWQIAKLSTASGMIKTWADGNASFDNVWDNRASLTYS